MAQQLPGPRISQRAGPSSLGRLQIPSQQAPGGAPPAFAPAPAHVYGPASAPPVPPPMNGLYPNPHHPNGHPIPHRNHTHPTIQTNTHTNSQLTAQLTAHTHTHTHTQKTKTPDTEGKPSGAITKGANALLALFEAEYAKLQSQHAPNQRSSHLSDQRASSSQSNLDDQRILQLVQLQYELRQKKTALRTRDTDLRVMETELRELKARSRRAVDEAQRSAWEAERALVALRAEHVNLLDAVRRVGLEWASVSAPRGNEGNGTGNGSSGSSSSGDGGELRFAPATARIVGDFVQGARLQETQMCAPGEPVDPMLFGNVGPEQFFEVLGRVLLKGRAYAEAIEMHRQMLEAQQQQEEEQQPSPQQEEQDQQQEMENLNAPPAPEVEDARSPTDPAVTYTSGSANTNNTAAGIKRPSPFDALDSPSAKYPRTEA